MTEKGNPELVIIINTIKIKQMKKIYEKPSMEVFKLKQTGMLMSSVNSGDVNATMDGTFGEEDVLLP